MLLYNLGVRAYALAIRVSAFRNAKAAQWVKGRQSWQKALREKLAPFGNQPKIWVHCASYGEFEQGRPVMEALKQEYPRHKILLSFFSPSGYEPLKDWPGADVVCYIPLDTRKNASQFLDIVKPEVVFFIKYEFWLNFLKAIKKRQISCYLVSAVFKPHHPFFKWYGSVFRRSLRAFTRLFIQDEKSGMLLKNINIHNFEICGDTRFDRVLQIRQSRNPMPEIEKFRGDAQLLIAGSTWENDEALVIGAFKEIQNNRLKLLLVPHDIQKDQISSVCRKLESAGLRYSVYSKGIDHHCSVLVLDTMGMLAGAYYYGDCAYIGGGFDGGLHNSLEAAVFYLPVTFYGKDYTKFNEAVDLLALGAAENVKDKESLVAAWKRFLDPAKKKQVASVLNHYFEKNRDSTGKVLSYIDF